MEELAEIAKKPGTLMGNNQGENADSDVNETKDASLTDLLHNVQYR